MPLRQVFGVETYGQLRTKGNRCAAASSRRFLLGCRYAHRSAEQDSGDAENRFQNVLIQLIFRIVEVSFRYSCAVRV